MPLFFFNLRQGAKLVLDYEGTMLRDEEQAQAEAMKAAREIMADQLDHGKSVGSEVIEVATEEGDVVAVVEIRSSLLRH